MKIFKNFSKSKKLHLLLIIFISLVLFNKDVFTNRFDKKLLKRYYLSQDITHEVDGVRQFLSDDEIYTATGYLYVTGKDPSEFNFEHPPFIKYLFGLSILLFNNPLIAQAILGLFLLIAMYLLGNKITGNPTVSFIATFLLILDPLFRDLVSKTLLDIGQTMLMLFYTYLVFFKKRNYILQGIILGLFAGTKFWVTPLFFIGIYFLYFLIKKEVKIKDWIFTFTIACITYSLLYIPTFIIKHGNFNLVWHILKTFKYLVDHDVSSYFGASLVFLMSGFIKAWWGTKQWEFIKPWFIIWPIGFLITTICSLKNIITKRKISLKYLFGFIPFLYIIFLGVQAPFPRYVLIILPFIYLILVDRIYSLVLFIKKKK